MIEINRRGIVLGNAPVVQTDATADLAIGLMIAANRRFHEGRLSIINSEWSNSPKFLLGNSIKGSTVGIIGFDGVGQTIAKRLIGFDVDEILYLSWDLKDVDEFGARSANFEEIIVSSDYLFVTSPLTNYTVGMIDSNVFERMKNTSVLINVARGGLLVQDDLYEALKCKKIFAAGIDVMTPEPLPANHPLLTLQNLSE